jgi:hypothetical protein
MNLINKFTCLSLFFCICTAEMAAQYNPVYIQLQKNRKMISKGRREIKPGLAIVEYYVDMGYDDSTLARLKIAGVDVEANLFKRDLNEKEKAVRSDCIIIGTVVMLEHPSATPEGTTRPFYGAAAYVNVEEFLRNDYHVSKGVIPVLIESNVVGAITLKPGEHVLLFLSAWSVITNFEYNTSPDYYAKMIRDTTIRFEIVGYEGKYLITSNKVNCNADKESKNLIDVKKDIKTIVGAIKKPR